MPVGFKTYYFQTIIIYNNIEKPHIHVCVTECMSIAEDCVVNTTALCSRNAVAVPIGPYGSIT